MNKDPNYNPEQPDQMPAQSSDKSNSAAPPKDASPNLSLPPVPHQLHVAIRGLICVRLSVQTKTVTLHVPQVNMHDGHIYRAGTYFNLRALTYGGDYRLEGVEPGNYKVDPRSFKSNFAALSIHSDVNQTDAHCSFQPRNTHATIQLPWPDSFKRLRPRMPMTGPKPLFTFGETGSLDPDVYYINYFTYNLQWTDRPILYKGDDTFWYSEALQPHTVLHFFADPPTGFASKAMHDSHIAAAYQAFNDQLFAPSFTLAEGEAQTMIQFNVPNDAADIPLLEQLDLTESGLLGGGNTGNCLSIVVTD